MALDQVSFRYGEATPEVLQQLSLRIEPGEYVAIVGASGSGKSTLLRVMFGFERLDEGEIYFDNKSLKALDLEALRGQCGIVLQGAGIFDGSLESNITCGRSYSPAQIDRAMELSSFGEELRLLPMGLDTMLLGGGAALSGGQRQKLLVARALIGEPSMLVLDEATSFLDSAAQSAVSRQIDSLPITRIVASHQLGAVKRADRICVLEGGVIVEEGSCDQLIAQRGSFFKLFQDQIEVPA